MSRSARALLLLALMAGPDVSEAAAQALGDLELTGGGVHASGRDGTSLGMVTGRAGFAAARWHAAGAGSVAWLGQGGSATYGSGLIGGWIPASRDVRLRGELAGGQGRDLARESSSFLRIGADAELPASGVTVGMGGSYAWAWLPESDRRTAGLRLTSAWRIGPAAVEAGGVALRSLETLALPASVGARRWVGDLTLAVRWQCPRCELSLAGTWRVAGRDVAAPTEEAALSGSVEAAWWPTDHVALVLTGGSAPGDVERGLVPVSSVRAGVRVGWRGSYLPPSAGPPLLTAVRVGPSTYRLRLRRPGEHHVFLRGDFSGWTPVRLERAGKGVWVSPPVRHTPGPVRIQMSLDGATWTPVPGLPRGSDEFGGEASVLVLEAGM